MAEDPVCGIIVNENEAKHKVEHMGSPYYFCASKCKDAFEKNPGKYLKFLTPGRGDERKVAIVGIGQVGPLREPKVGISANAFTGHG